jgi:hypothetical protein
LILGSKCISKLARLRPPSASLSSLDHGLPVHLQTRQITASKCISELARLQAPSASLSPLDHGLHLHLHTRSITASKCISKLAQSQSPSVSLNSHDYRLKHARSWLSSVSPDSLDHDLRVHLSIHFITASKCISKSAQLLPPSASPKSLDHGVGVYLSVHSNVIFRRTLNCSLPPPAASRDIPFVDG